MSFNLYPVTLNYWCNYYMVKWDVFARENPFNLRILQTGVNGGRLPLFKSDDIDDYKRFRSIMQVMDMLVMDVNVYRYDKREVMAAAIYV